MKEDADIETSQWEKDFASSAGKFKIGWKTAKLEKLSALLLIIHEIWRETTRISTAI